MPDLGGGEHRHQVLVAQPRLAASGPDVADAKRESADQRQTQCRTDDLPSALSHRPVDFNRLAHRRTRSGSIRYHLKPVNLCLPDIEAVSFDFYNTLVYHRTGQGRGAALMEYLRQQGWESEPWEHQVLYDIFEPHGREYGTQLSDSQRRSYWLSLSQRLFQRLNVLAPEEAAAEHAADIWRLLGPSCLSVFPDALQILPRLKEAGFPLALVSNWQCGLGNFCADLGLAGFFDHVLASAEVGSAKPDAGIFLEACRRLDCPAERVLHVGDSDVEDCQGGRGAGLEVLLLRREAHQSPPLAAEVTTLGQVASLLGLE